MEDGNTIIVQVYKIRDKNGKEYIGTTTTSLKLRKYQHQYNKRKNQNRCSSGELDLENATISLLEVCNSDNRNERETYWIEQHPECVNIMLNGKYISNLDVNVKGTKRVKKATPKEMKAIYAKRQYIKHGEKLREKVRIYRATHREELKASYKIKYWWRKSFEEIRRDPFNLLRIKMDVFN